MEDKERLVESIFSRLHRKGQKPRKVSSLFQPSPASYANAPSVPAALSNVKVDKRFPVGLDIGKTSLKWVQLGAYQKKLCVLSMGWQPLDMVKSLTEQERYAVIGRRLTEIAAQNRLHGPAVISLPLDEVNLRVFKIPTTAEAEVESAVRWQLEQTLPPQTKYEDLVIDYVVLDKISRDWEAEVLVATLDRNRISALIQKIQQSGLEPIAVEIDAFALASCLDWRELFRPQETDLMLHLGLERSSLSVIVSGQLVFSRSLLVNGLTFTRAVSEFMHVPFEEAENLKQTHGIAAPGNEAKTELEGGEGNDPKAQVSKALASQLENLLVDILHSFKSFSYQVSQSQIQKFDRVILCGGTSRLPGLAPYLESRLGVPVEIADPLAGLPLLPSVKSDKPEASLKYRLGIAMGLALREAAG